MMKLNDSVFWISNLDPVDSTSSIKLAMFDIDNTITNSKGKLPISETDWSIQDPVLNKLINLNESGYRIYFISNQSGSDSNEKIFRLNRLRNIFNFLSQKIKLAVYAAVRKDKFRKPETGIFEEFIFPELNLIESGFYVGDAAGRPGDFADSDIKYAFNISIFLKFKGFENIKFWTPEEYFYNEKTSGKRMSGFDPGEFLTGISSSQLPEKESGVLEFIRNLDKQSVIFLIGPPGSGKSTLTAKLKTIRPDLQSVSQDESGTKARVLKEFHEKIKSGVSVIVDNTNPTKSSRSDYLLPGLNPVGILMKTFPEPEKDKDLYKHLLAYRTRIGGKKIPELTINVFYKKLELPEFPVLEYPFNPSPDLDFMRFLQLE